MEGKNVDINTKQSGHGMTPVLAKTSRQCRSTTLKRYTNAEKMLDRS